MTALRAEDGFSVMELLMAMTLLIVVLGATLLPFESFWKNERQTTLHNEAQDEARSATDRLARELRSGAAATQLVERADGADLVFQVADPRTTPSGSNTANTKRVRYCVDQSTPRRLVRQQQTWTTATPPAMPDTSACPHAAWGGSTVVARDVVNGTTPVFEYDNATAANVTSIRTRLLIDRAVGERPGAADLRTGISLRNKNSSPTATFTATAQGNRFVRLDGTGSADPEGSAITYRWCLTSGCSDANKIGSGQIFDYQAAATGDLTVYLVVLDSCGASAETSLTVTGT